MFIKKEDIKRFLDKSPYKKYLYEITELIQIHHKNYQSLLLNKELFPINPATPSSYQF